MSAEDPLPPVLSGTRRGNFYRLILIGMSVAIAALGSALLTTMLFDQFFAGEAGSGVVALGSIGLVLCVSLSSLMRWAERVEAERLGQNYVHVLRQQVFDNLSQVSPRVLQTRGKGGIALRFTGDLSAIRQWTSLGLARLVVASIALALAITGLLFMNPVLGLSVGAVLAVGVFFAAIQGKVLRDAVAHARKARTILANNVIEKLGAMGVVQTQGGAARERKRHTRQSHKVEDAMVDRARAVGRLRAVVHGTAGIATVGSLLVGALLVAAGSTTPGTVVGAMVLVSFLAPAIQDLGRVGEYWQSAQVSREKLIQLLALPRTVRNTDVVRRGRRARGRIEFRNVSVAGALDSIHGRIKPGQTVALIGASAAGKSTLLGTIARLVDVDEGELRIDGVAVDRISLGSLRRATGVMSPDLPLLRGTLEKNLRYRAPDATEEELAQVCARCRVDEIIDELPDGLQTKIQEGGSNLSLGQRHRVQLARAIVGSPAILLLDEPGANADLETREAIRDVLREYQGTVLVATHDRHLVSSADLVWKLEKGRLVQANAPSINLPKILPPLGEDQRRAAVSQQIPEGQIVALGEASEEPEALLYKPQGSSTDAPIVVVVHGIARSPHEQLRMFAPAAERFGAILLAPFFSAVRDRGYQRLGRQEVDKPADLRLIEVLEDLRRKHSLNSERIHLFGYSGGGQFAHRFALAHPHRVASLVVAAAGWYSMPDSEVAYPRGIAPDPAYPDLTLHLEDFLSLPITVCVGERDTLRDESLNRSKRINRMQGRDRVERAQRWVESMQTVAKERDIDARISLCIMPDIGHSFVDCVQSGNLASLTFESFFPESIDAEPDLGLA